MLIICIFLSACLFGITAGISFIAVTVRSEKRQGLDERELVRIWDARAAKLVADEIAKIVVDNPRR